MKYFVLQYDRATGGISVETYPVGERSAALARRFELEARPNNPPTLEIVVLAADSLEQVKTTHGRYFKTALELAQ